MRANILVVKLGALGDVIQALGSFAAIRRHHADAHITLLTAAAFADFLRGSGYFDDVWIDGRPSVFRPDQWLALRRRLRGGGLKDGGESRAGVGWNGVAEKVGVASEKGLLKEDNKLLSPTELGWRFGNEVQAIFLP